MKRAPLMLLCLAPCLSARVFRHKGRTVGLDIKGVVYKIERDLSCAR